MLKEKLKQTKCVKKSLIIALIVMLLAITCVGTVSADDYVNPTKPITFDASQIDQFVPWEDNVFGNYLYYNPTSQETEVDIWEMIKSTMLPFTNIFGEWLPCIMLFAYFFSVYSRSRGLEIVALMGLILIPLMYQFLVPTSLSIYLICIGIALTSILFKLFKRRA